MWGPKVGLKSINQKLIQKLIRNIIITAVEVLCVIILDHSAGRYDRKTYHDASV